MLLTLLAPIWIGLALIGALAALLAGYLIALAVANLVASGPPTADERPCATSRLAVVIPAHDEEALIGRCLRSLAAQTYPPELFELIVIADNCTDATAEIASSKGATVMVRESPDKRGKGHALRWATDLLLGRSEPPDAVVVVDADSVLDPGMLAHLEACFARGAEAVQAEYGVLVEGSSRREALIALGFMLFHRVRLGGRAALGLPASLVGNGMLFARDLLMRQPWDAFTGAEDLEYTVRLRLTGVRPSFAPGAVVLGPIPAPRSGATQQRLRWEGGRFHVQRAYLGRLVLACLRGPARPWDMALDLAVPPLGLLAMLSGAGAMISTLAALLGAIPWWSAAPWVAAAIEVPLFVMVGMAAARASAASWSALLSAPFFLLWKLLTYTRLLRGFDPHRWIRSERPQDDEAAHAEDRFSLLEVPVDPVTMDTAVARIVEALDSTQLYQVATVNLDFVVTAQRRPDVRRILGEARLNLADGAPVVWLGRLLGRPVPERVAGADLVPRLLAAAASRGLRVYLLGGEGGAAADAAQAITHRYPGVVIAGCFEPARAAVEEMDNEAILEHINETRPDLLLVALGHPKQERWIDRHRDRLAVPVAIGVGCVLDILAGRVSRAPRWMQRTGLEWFFRLAHEPGRLLGRYALNARWLVLLTTRVLLQRFAW